MGKEIRVLCDSCGADVFGQVYFTLNIRKIVHGTQARYPAVYLCPDCFRKTKLTMQLCEFCTKEDQK